MVLGSDGRVARMYSVVKLRRHIWGYIVIDINADNQAMPMM